MIAKDDKFRGSNLIFSPLSIHALLSATAFLESFLQVASTLILNKDNSKQMNKVLHYQEDLKMSTVLAYGYLMDGVKVRFDL